MKSLLIKIGVLGLFPMAVNAAVVNIDAMVDASGWTTSKQFIGDLDQLPALVGYTINQGDTVNLNIDFLNNESLKLTADSGGISGLGFMLDRGSNSSLYTIENISVTLNGFETDGTWDGSFSKESADVSGFGLGPSFTQADVGVQDGEFIQFSGFQASYTITDVSPGSDEFLYTTDALINWKIETVSTVPIPAAAWLMGSGLLGLGGLGVIKRRKTA